MFFYKQLLFYKYREPVCTKRRYILTAAFVKKKRSGSSTNHHRAECVTNQTLSCGVDHQPITIVRSGSSTNHHHAECVINQTPSCGLDHQPITIVRTWLYVEATPSADIFRGGLTGVVERKYRRCAVVGNSGIVLRHRNGAKVDEHDMARTATVLNCSYSLLICTDRPYVGLTTRLGRL